MWQLDQDPEVMRYINGGKPTPIETTRDVYLPRLKSYTNAEKGWGMWRIALTDSDEFLGWILVRPVDFFTDQPLYSNLELGWRLHRSAWGKGYATEAAKAVMAHGTSTLGIKRIVGITSAENQPSIKVLEKIGLRFDKMVPYSDDEESMLFIPR